MVHYGWHTVLSNMFAMATDARLDIRMERGRLALQQRTVVRVAGNAEPGLDALDRGMAGAALVFECGMGSGQRPWGDGLLPNHSHHVGAFWPSVPEPKHSQPGGKYDQYIGQRADHGNHRNPY